MTAYRDDQWIVDIVLAQTGSVGRLGPFRSVEAAEAHRDMINREIERAGLSRAYFAELYEVTDPRNWRSVVDLSPDE